MRVTDDNTQFFRMANSQNVQTEQLHQSHRVWLNLYNDTNFRQMLLGYIEGATNNFDRLYDGDSFTGNEINLYSILSGHNLVIQGRALPFDAADVIPLGYKVASGGTYFIAVDEVDGVFAGQQEVYLRDNVLNITHDLKSGTYSFLSDAGTFNNRFELIFSGTALSNPELGTRDAVAFISHKKLFVSAPGNIVRVDIYDVTGKLVSSIIPTENKTTLESGFEKPNGVYFAKIGLANNIVIDKKLMH
jgi:hypothetical protein